MNDWTSKRRMAPEKMMKTMAKRVIQSLAFVNICKDGDNGRDESSGYLISLMDTVTDKSYPKIELATEDDPDKVINVLELDKLTEMAFTDDTLLWTDLETREITTVTFPIKASCKKFLEALDDHRPDIFFKKCSEKGWPLVRNQEPESMAQPAFPEEHINAEGQEIEVSGQFKKEMLDFLGQNEAILSRAVLLDDTFWKEFIDSIPQLRIRSVAIMRSIFFNNILPVVWRRNVKRSLKMKLMTLMNVHVSLAQKQHLHDVDNVDVFLTQDGLIEEWQAIGVENASNVSIEAPRDDRNYGSLLSDSREDTVLEKTVHHENIHSRKRRRLEGVPLSTSETDPTSIFSHRNELILFDMMFEMIANNEKVPKQGRKVYEALAKKLGQHPNVWDRWRHRFNDVILPKLHTYPMDPDVILTILRAVKQDVSEVHLAMEHSFKMKITLENGLIREWEKNERDDVVMGNGVDTEIPQIVYLSSDPETQMVELAELKRRGELFEARFPSFVHVPDWDLDESFGTLQASSVKGG